jgi:hypothetical protein
LVLPGGQPDGTHGGHHEPAAAAGGGGSGRTQRRANTLYLTPLHGKANILKPLTANVHAALQHVKAAAEQFKTMDRGTLMLRYVSDKIAPTLGPFRPPNGLPATG